MLIRSVVLLDQICPVPPTLLIRSDQCCKNIQVVLYHLHCWLDQISVMRAYHLRCWSD